MKINFTVLIFILFGIKGLTEELILKALDKSLEVVKELNQSDESKESNKLSYPSDFYVFDKEKNLWLEVDIMEEVRRKHLNQNL